MTRAFASESRIAEEALPLAAATALVAGRALRAERGRWAETLSAEGRDIKLRADLTAEALIVEQLSARSAWPILSEERGWSGAPAAADQPCWVVDPLDGSFNYARGVPFCCTAIALCIGRRPLAGVVYDFNHDELFRGSSAGAWCNESALTPQIVRTRAAAAVATGFPVGGDASPAGIEQIVAGLHGWKKIRMLGSAALSIAYVAAGRLDCYAESGIYWWDVAAALAILGAAGGHWRLDGAARVDAPLTIEASWQETGA